ncbi:MAG TPA: helix-turn-helix transcriptional regulator [Pseudonocardiaceae bacterium]|nr:helix-turn-helix transcriptional regulator [Pseudonocardiaceae bacterium]
MPELESDALLARQVGERLRLARRRRHKQQTVVAGLAGITTDYLSQIERGLKLPSLTVLIELARVLDMPLSALFGEASSDSRPGRATMSTRSDARKAAKPAFIFDASPAPSSVPIGDRLYAAMTAPSNDCFGLVTHDSSLTDKVCNEQLLYGDLDKQVCNAWHVWQHSPQRYSHVGALAPTLVINVEQQLWTLQGDDVRSERRNVARHASDLYGLLRSFCKRLDRMELSLLSADRAIRTAELADDPVRLAAAHWNLAHVLLADGHVEGAEDVATMTTDTLRTSLNSDSDALNAELAAVYGALLLVGAMAAVQRGDAWTARARVDEAARLAEKTGELNACWTVFGPTNVAMHVASIELVTGHAAEGLRIAERIDHRAVPSIERRIAFLLDQAQGWWQRRDNAHLLLLLLEAEREAPEDMCYRPTSRQLIQHLVKHGRRSVAEQAAQMAARLQLPI